MAGANGTAAGSILRLGSLVPERLPVTIERGGEEITLQGYVYGKRCPGLVKAECAAAEEKRAGIMGDSSIDEAAKQAAWFDFLRSHLLALVPGLEWNEADVLAGDTPSALNVLRYLGAWVDATETAESDGEAEEAGPLTTAGSLPTSSDATPSALTSS